ncbi:glycosyltransferase family 4 protein [Patescibacteria group bacterium]
MEKSKKKNSVKKKIVIFIPEFPVLTETFIQRDIVKLVELGSLDVSVVCLKIGKANLDESLKDLVFEARLSPLKSLVSLKYFVTKKDEIKRIKDLLKEDEGSGVKKFYLLIKSLGYASILGSYNPDELHIHFYSDFSSIGMFASIILGIPFSVNAHARDVFEYPHLPKAKGKLAKFIAICNNRAHKHCIDISEVGEEKIHLIYHGIDPKTIFLETKKGEKGDTPTIFMGGTRITEKKGIEYMIEASRILKDRGIKHRVALIGVGDKYSELEEMIKEKDLEDVFFLHGGGKGLPFSEVSKFLFSSDIFALPIIQTKAGDSDGIPNVIIEAALAKLPIVTTNAGSVSELIKNDETGVVVPQKDSETLATEIEKLLFDEEKKKRISQAAYEKALEMFDAETNVKRLETLLRQ